MEHERLTPESQGIDSVNIRSFCRPTFTGAVTAAFVCLLMLAPLPVRAGDDIDAPDDTFQWGNTAAHLQIGCKLNGQEFRLGQPITLSVRMHLGDPEAKGVRVVSTGPLDLYEIRFYRLDGMNRWPIPLTKEGFRRNDPMRSIAARGIVFSPTMRPTTTLPITEWWDVSRPGKYVVYMAHFQPLPGSPAPQRVEAPPMNFVVNGN